MSRKANTIAKSPGLGYKRLKARQRAERAGHPPNLALRVHRALSWLDRAEQAYDDVDGQFIFLWIAFNAAYATDIDERYRAGELDTFRAFLGKLLSLDADGRLGALVWSEFSGSLRGLLDNEYVFHDFWSYQRGEIDEAEWRRRFEKANASARKALEKQDVATVLNVVLSRIYTLRNQLIHGGATWNSSVNRAQVRDCGNFMGKLVPLMIELMMDHPDTLWGDACFPVVDPASIGTK